MRNSNDVPPDDYSDWNFLFWLYKGRCIICWEHGSEINEIIPRIRNKTALRWRNQVLLCNKHHTEYHAQGLTDEKLQMMKEKRVEFLISIGREEYV